MQHVSIDDFIILKTEEKKFINKDNLIISKKLNEIENRRNVRKYIYFLMKRLKIAIFMKLNFFNLSHFSLKTKLFYFRLNIKIMVHMNIDLLRLKLVL